MKQNGTTEVETLRIGIGQLEKALGQTIGQMPLKTWAQVEQWLSSQRAAGCSDAKLFRNFMALHPKFVEPGDPFGWLEHLYREAGLMK
jgi:hypothetical protein